MPEPRLDVLCIGNAIVDVIADASDQFLLAEGLAKDSMRLVDADEAKRLYDHMEIAREAKRNVAFSLSDLFCVDRHRDGFTALIEDGRIDILFANEAEILAMGGVPHLETAVAAIAPKVETLVVTRGAAGALAVRAGERADVPAEPVDKVVDTTGAGDLFAAGFLYGE